VTRHAALVLDSEAVQALRSRSHPKHRRVLSFIEGMQQRARRREPMPILVPIAVRVEAPWDRRAPASAFLNKVSRAHDVLLDARRADRAAGLVAETGVSVVDATVAEAAEAAPSPTVILTSDVADMERLAALLRGGARVVRI
jgi:hypothetical protein